MARLFPKIDPSKIENSGERTMAQALVSQLPSQVEVFHSFFFLGTNRCGTLMEGECDFVLLDPANGMLFIEVKGGALEFDPKKMEWLRVLPTGQQRVINKDPFAQASRSMHEILERVRKGFPLGADQLPFTYGYAVAFPDCRYTGSLPPSIAPDLILDAGKCRDLKTSVQRIFDRFRRQAYPELSSPQLETIRETLYPKYSLVPVTWCKIEDQEERLCRLTAEQERALNLLAINPKFAIQGVAGSGKTILALSKAQAAARDGMRTLFLCYNRPLKDWILQTIPDTFAASLVIDTYHGLVDDFCRKASVPFKTASNLGNTEFWTSEAPERLMEACDLLGLEHKFDVVIVDEGQDFHSLWWTSLEGVFRDPGNKGCYYVFFDPNQNIYVDNPDIPGELGKAYSLQFNCRNTARIAAHCAALVKVPNQVHEGAPQGDKPVIVLARTLRDGFAEAGKCVRTWCMPNAGGLKPSQVVVLAPGSFEREWPKDFQTVPITRDFDQWRKGKGVLLTSWARFKGLEADAIVILEPPMVDDVRENANRYVARSRAKHLLTIIQVETT